MNILQNLDTNSLAYLGFCCALLCGGIFVVGFVFQIVGGFFEIFFGFFEVILEILQGGPVAWCGCLVAVFGCIGCSGFVFLLLNAQASCAAYETNFCVLFGF